MTIPDAHRQATTSRRARRRSEGIALLIVLVIVMLLVTAVYLFQRRAVINTTIARNRVAAAEADALARGGLRIAEAALFLMRLREEQEAAGGDGAGAAAAADPGLAALAGGSTEPWRMLDELAIDLEQGQSLRLQLEDAGARLNLNALVPAIAADQGEGGEEGENSGLGTSIEDHEEATLYLTEVLDYIVAGIDEPGAAGSYDTREIAESLIDWMDEDDETRSGRSEDDSYAGQDPPYRPRNGPFLSFEEIGLVQGVDPVLLDALRDYLTVHPIGGTAGINLNSAPPWVLKLVSAGTSGDRRLLDDDTVREIWRLREQEDKILCEDSGSDPERCVSLAEARIEGSLYPETVLPATARVFRVVAEARVGALTRRMEAIVDTRSLEGPQLLSWRRLRGAE